MNENTAAFYLTAQNISGAYIEIKIQNLWIKKIYLITIVYIVNSLVLYNIII